MLQILVRRGIGYNVKRVKIRWKMKRDETMIHIAIPCELDIRQWENSEIHTESAIMWKVQHEYIQLQLTRDKNMWLMENLLSAWLEDQSKFWIHISLI